MQRKKLSDILRNTRDFEQAWDSTEAAADLAPLPPGEYAAHLHALDLFNAKTKGTPGAKLTFRLIEGEHAGRFVWCDLWLSAAAMPLAKRDLAKLGITTRAQLEQPVPPGIRCAVKVALRTADDGTAYNHVSRFDVLGIDKIEPDPFAPQGQGGPQDGF